MYTLYGMNITLMKHTQCILKHTHTTEHAHIIIITNIIITVTSSGISPVSISFISCNVALGLTLIFLFGRSYHAIDIRLCNCHLVNKCPDALCHTLGNDTKVLLGKHPNDISFGVRAFDHHPEVLITVHDR